MYAFVDYALGSMQYIKLRANKNETKDKWNIEIRKQRRNGGLHCIVGMLIYRKLLIDIIH